jgi:hypothetical protein
LLLAYLQGALALSPASAAALLDITTMGTTTASITGTVGNAGVLLTLNKLFSGGNEGEEFLAQLVGGESQQYFETSLGKRFVDQLANGVAYESKVGFVRYTKDIETQILKDSEILNAENSELRGSVWTFFRSAITGEVGADQRVLDLLTKHGIKYIIMN